VEKTFNVIQEVKVQVDESKFTEEYLKVFRECFYDFEDINDHMEHLAQGYARGLWDGNSFIEGYGNAKDMGIQFSSDEAEVEEVDE